MGAICVGRPGVSQFDTYIMTAYVPDKEDTLFVLATIRCHGDPTETYTYRTLLDLCRQWGLQHILTDLAQFRWAYQEAYLPAVGKITRQQVHSKLWDRMYKRRKLLAKRRKEKGNGSTDSV